MEAKDYFIDKTGRVLASVNVKEKICQFLSTVAGSAVKPMNFLS